MESLKTDKERIQTIRQLVRENRLDPDALESFINSYEELIELTEASIEMIDHLVHKLHSGKSV
ncbi:MAG: hypothetical protein KI791_02620 [Cyclobacteriaceae bacterium]|nr:hypothetical protein [Cyclobacteriaceae bacterium SS2]